MTETERREGKPEPPETSIRPQQEDRRPEPHEPVSDSDAIAEVGDAVGGPA